MCPDGRTRDALEAEAGHARPGAHRTLVRRDAGTHRASSGSVGLGDVLPGDLHPAGVVEVGVIALSHDRDDDVLADLFVLGDHQFARGVIHPAELHRRREEDGGFEQSPLPCRQQAGALAGPVEHGGRGWHRSAEQVDRRVGHDGGDARASDRFVAFAVPHGDVAHPYPRYVGDGVVGAGGEPAEAQPEVARPLSRVRGVSGRASGRGHAGNLESAR